MLNRMTTSKQCSDLFKHNPKEFRRRFVSVDKTWIRHYTPETKEQSKEWTSPVKPAPKKARTVPWAGKAMATVFWDLEKARTIKGQYYAEFLGRFDDALKRKRPQLAKNNVLFHRDNAPAH